MTHTPDPTSTFTPRLGLEKARKGTCRGTWTDLVNDNLDLIDAAAVTGGYDALVYQDGGDTVAEDRHGATIASGDDVSAVLQAAIAPGGTVIVGAGEYVLTADQHDETLVHPYECCLVVTAETTTRIVGAGPGQTILKLADNQHYTDHAAVMLLAIGTYSSPTYDGLEVAHLTLDGNKANQTFDWVDGSGCILTGGRQGTSGNQRRNTHLHHLEIKNSTVAGIYLGHNCNGRERFALLDHLYVHDCGGHGIELDTSEHTTARNITTAGNGADTGDYYGIIAYNSAATVGARAEDDRVVLENLVMYDTLSCKYLQHPVIRGLYSDTTGIACKAGVRIDRCVGAVVEVDCVLSDEKGIWALTETAISGEPTAYIHNRGLIRAVRPINIDYEGTAHVFGGELRGVADETCYGFYASTAGNHCSNVYFGADLDLLIAGGTGTTYLTGCRSAALKPSYGAIVNCGGNVNFGLQATGTSTGTGSEQTIAHGLRAAPSRVSVTPTVTGATVSAVWADATNLYATVTTDKAYAWSAET